MEGHLMKPVMETHHVSYTYPGSNALALHDLNISIREGKKTAVCGHNGSGKSTFFLHAVGIHRPTTGQVIWKGSPLAYGRPYLQQLRQRVGIVFQDPEQQIILNTPYEDITYGLRNARVPEDEIRVRTEQILAAMGLRHLADTPVHHLSLGQKKRVALAGVLVLEPELLLLDEPTAYLDRSSELQLIEELGRIHDSGVTVVMATHDMNLAYSWADRILVMDRGTCVMEGCPQEIFKEANKLRTLGLEQPVLLELWQALPEAVRGSAEPPRSVAQFKQLLANKSIV